MSNFPNETFNAIQMGNVQVGQMGEALSQQMQLLTRVSMDSMELQQRTLAILNEAKTKQEQLKARKDYLFSVKAQVDRIESGVCASLAFHWELRKQHQRLQQSGFTQEAFDDYRDKEYFVAEQNRLNDLLVRANTAHGQEVIDDFQSCVHLSYRLSLLLWFRRL